jgi:hypothetical protein
VPFVIRLDNQLLRLEKIPILGKRVSIRDYIGLKSRGLEGEASFSNGGNWRLRKYKPSSIAEGTKTISVILASILCFP